MRTDILGTHDIALQEFAAIPKGSERRLIVVIAVKLSDIVQHLGTILSIVILLLTQPAIMASARSSMTYWQHLGTIILGITLSLSLQALRQMRNKR
jgi:hypothetical protein